LKQRPGGTQKWPNGFEESGRRERGLLLTFHPWNGGKGIQKRIYDNHSVNFRISEFSLFTTRLTAKSLYFNAKKTIFPGMDPHLATF